MITAIVAIAIACTVTDGDTIRCGDERIRLNGIDAPETHGCASGRHCVDGDGAASTARRRALMAGAVITIRRIGTDHYGRTIGVVYADGVNLSCAMIEAGRAEYVARWDDGGLIASECPAAAR